MQKLFWQKGSPVIVRAYTTAVHMSASALCSQIYGPEGLEYPGSIGLLSARDGITPVASRTKRANAARRLHVESMTLAILLGPAMREKIGVEFQRDTSEAA